MEILLQLDREITLWINQHYSDWADVVMRFMSAKTVWIPLYLLFIYGVYRVYGQSNGIELLKIQRSRRTNVGARERTEVRDRAASAVQRRNLKILGVLVAAALCVAAVGLADFLSVHLFKNVFMRLRPCFEPDLEGLLRFYVGASNSKHLYGFVSSHAANVFALAAFLTPMLRKYKVVHYGGIYLWAALVGYSRIYLGKHYLGDVICGALLGFAIGTAMYYLCKKLIRNI